MHDQNRNEEIRKQTKITNIARKIAKVEGCGWGTWLAETMVDGVIKFLSGNHVPKNAV